MTSLLHVLRRAVPDTRNDMRPATKGRRASLVILPEKREKLFWFLTAGFLCIVMTLCGLAFWMMQDTRHMLDAAMQNEPSLALRKTASATTSATPPVSAAAAGDLPGGIALPATALIEDSASLNQTHDRSVLAQVVEKNGARPFGTPQARNQGLAGSPIDAITLDDDTTANSNASNNTPKLPTLADAQAAMQSGDYQGALAAYNVVLDGDHDNLAALRGKARALEALGQDKSAMAVDHQLLRRDPQDGIARHQLANLMAQDDTTDLDVRSSQPTSPQPTLTAYGRLALPQQQLTDTETATFDPSPDYAASSKIEHALAENTRARRDFAKNHLTQAATHFDRAVRLDPDNLDYRLSLAITYDHMGQSASALGVYRQVLDLLADQDESAHLLLPVNTIRARASYLENAVTP
jgi:tetratricopeptide (TPR) repeat protein